MKRKVLPLLVFGAAIAFGTIESRAEAIAPATAEVTLESLPKGVYIVKADYAGSTSRLKIMR